jgi:hypothetical protein
MRSSGKSVDTSKRGGVAANNSMEQAENLDILMSGKSPDAPFIIPDQDPVRRKNQMEGFVESKERMIYGLPTDHGRC